MGWPQACWRLKRKPYTIADLCTDMARRVTAGHEALRQSEHQTFDQNKPPLELVALDGDGEELYRTESFDSREEAQEVCDTFDEGSAYWTESIPDKVDRFEPRRKE
jgi:hypothetical protein